jgi:hypothetical protein
MSARLFACFTLVEEAAEVQSEERATRRGAGAKHVLPVLNLLKAMVQAESTALGRQVEKRKVQFAGFDGSSTKPPKDNVIGSHLPREESIQALEKALKEVNALLADEGPKDDATTCLKSIIGFLAKFGGGNCENESGFKLRTECAIAMPFAWHAERFEKAASSYHDDLTKILTCFEKNAKLAEIEGSLQLEEQLVLALGQGIRFHLRRFFNPMYFKVTVSPDLDDLLLDKCNTRLSRVSEMLEMRLPEGYNAGDDSAVRDGSISSVFSLALQAIAQYFGDDFFLEESFTIPDLPNAFCTSPASQRGLGGRKKPVEVVESDTECVLNDIFEARQFLATAKACRFMFELLSWPGVQAEIGKLGGWDIVEHYAVLIRANNLSRLAPDDTHFVVLARMDRFLPRVEKCWEAMKPAAETAKEALDGVWDVFECGSTNRNRRLRYPQIEVIEEALLEGLKMHMFPFIAEPTQPPEEHQGDDEKLQQCGKKEKSLS